MAPPTSPFQPYAALHLNPQGPGEERPTAIQVVRDCNISLRDKVCLITGCSSGIGVETARALHEAGATLFLTARDMPKLERVIDGIVSSSSFSFTGAAPPPRPQAIELHLDSLDGVRAGAEALLAKSNELNILIANAGVMGVPLSHTPNGFERHMGTNYFGHFLLFALLDPSCYHLQLLQEPSAASSASRLLGIASVTFASMTCTGPPSTPTQLAAPARTTSGKRTAKARRRIYTWPIPSRGIMGRATSSVYRCTQAWLRRS